MSRKVILTDAVPDIEKYWDYEKNGDKLPSEYAASSSERIYTFCPICNNSLFRTVRNTWKKDDEGVGRVLRCRNCSKLNESNSLIKLFPDIVKYWNYDKNEHSPEYYAVSSGKYVYIKCPECGEDKYNAICDVINITENGKYRISMCSKCARKQSYNWDCKKDAIISNCVTEIYKYWNYEKNETPPEKLTIGSKKKIYINCPKCGKILFRTANNSFRKKDNKYEIVNCQRCMSDEKAKYMAMERNGAIINECPEIDEWWNYDKNKVTPYEVTRGAHTKVYLKCPACEYELLRDIHSVVAMHIDGKILPVACPECGYSSKGDSENNLESECPEIKEWWNYEKNKPFEPRNFTRGSQYRAYLNCPECGVELYTGIHSLVGVNEQERVIIKHNGKCRKLKALNSENNLVLNYPEIAEWWDHEKNYPNKPEEFTLFSPFGAWFKCPKCSGTSKMRICDAMRKDNVENIPNVFRCSYCLDIKTLSGYNDLRTTNPELAMEWSDNNKLESNQVRKQQYLYPLWICPICKGEYRAKLSEREVGDDSCPYCSARKTLSGYNDLRTTNPELAMEWSDNNKLESNQVRKQQYLYPLWICPICKGEYRAKLSEREVGDDSCPYCSARKTLSGYNDLRTTNPELAREWSDNNELKSNQVRKQQSTYTLWICPTCKGEYRAKLSEREVGDDACPYCSNKRILSGYNSIDVKHPDLMNQWLELENILIGASPSMIMDTSDIKVWWKCELCNEKYMMSIRNRVMKKKRNHNPCPKCNGRRWKKAHFV